jgi:large subunit ribosomal protein L32
MAVPRNRSSNARKNSKRSHHAKVAVQLSSCSNCGSARKPHTMCPSCGQYKGRAVLAGKVEQE